MGQENSYSVVALAISFCTSSYNHNCKKAISFSKPTPQFNFIFRINQLTNNPLKLQLKRGLPLITNFKYTGDTMKTIYSLKLARFLIDKGFYCEKVVPHPYKPWMNAYVFQDTPALTAAMTEYIEEREQNDK